MSGHSKWSSIKRKKAATDQRRAAAWGKLIREITVAAKMGGGDPAANPRLRLAIDTARSANMPNENVDRAIKKGTGDLEGVDYQESTYEAYGPGGVALFIETLTDNVNRTVAEIRHALSKHGGNLGTDGSVAWMFDHKGQIFFDASRYDEATLLEAALEAGAEDLESEGDERIIDTEIGDFHAVQDALRARGLEWESAELAMVPTSLVRVEGKDAEKLIKLIDALEDSDDIQKVYTNADIDETSLVEARPPFARAIVPPEPHALVILGIDPGTAVTGYGVVETLDVGSPRLIECGVIRTSPRSALSSRLREIFEGVTELMDRHAPAAVAVEGVFFGKNARSAMVLGHARGVILLAASLGGRNVAEYSPAEVKNAIVGTGRATKDQVGFMTQKLLRLREPPRPADAADGVAVALCHCFRRGSPSAAAVTRRPAPRR